MHSVIGGLLALVIMLVAVWGLTRDVGDDSHDPFDY